MAGNGKAAKPRKIPLRRCTGCGESFPKKELIRVVRGPDGTVSLDFAGKAGGRGADEAEADAGNEAGVCGRAADVRAQKRLRADGSVLRRRFPRPAGGAP